MKSDSTQPRFKIGDIVNSSISGPREIIDIRLGVESDFDNYYQCIGELCYVCRYIDGKRLTVVYSIECVDSDHHLQGSEMYEYYQSRRNKR